MDTPEKIQYETPSVFVPTEIQVEILHAVADQQGCHIGDVVNRLYPSRSESSIRAGVHTLLSRGFLDGGNSSREVLLRLTSRGRILLQPGNAR